jgi:hypothetical protein
VTPSCGHRGSQATRPPVDDNTTIGEKERREDKCEDLVRLLRVVPRGWQEGAEEEKLPPPTICNGAVVRDSGDNNIRESELL